MSLIEWSGPVEALFGLDIANVDRDAEYEHLDESLMPLIEKREQAREQKDWSIADNIRDDLAKNNITLLDTDSGPIWQFLR